MKFSKRNSFNKHRGFTLIELLVVIVIIIILMGILIPVIGGAQRKVVKTRAKNNLTQLVTAVDTYYSTYNILPANTRSAPSQDLEVNTTEPIMSVLAGFNIDEQNRKEQKFFTGEVAKGTSRSNATNGLWTENNGAILCDPWKKTGDRRGYLLLLDYDYSESLQNPFRSGQQIQRRAVGWANGKDGKWSRGSEKSEDNKDNVLSW